MAIHPIDLQTLYSQMEKVGRQQGAEQQIAATARDAQQAQNKLDAQKKLSSVQGIEPGSDNTLKINKDGHSDDKRRENHQGKKENFPEAEEKDSLIKDPHLGQKIDISG